MITISFYRTNAKSCKINRYSSLLSTSAHVVQEQASIIKVLVEDHARLGHGLCLLVTESCNDGKLTDITTNMTIQAAGYTLQNELSASEYSNGFQIKYVSNKYFFSYPSHTFYGTPIAGIKNDSIFAVTMDCRNENIRSIPKEISIIIQNVNDPTNITYSAVNDPVTVYPSGSTNSNVYVNTCCNFIVLLRSG